MGLVSSFARPGKTRTPPLQLQTRLDQIDLEGARLSVSQKREAPDVKLNGLLAERRGDDTVDATDTVHDAALGDAMLAPGFGRPADLPAAPTLKHPEQEEDEGGRPVTVLEDGPLDFRARACSKRLGARCGRRTGVRRADSAHRSHAGGYEQYTHDGRITATPENLIC